MADQPISSAEPKLHGKYDLHWRRQHPKPVRYVTSGPPRDLVGASRSAQAEERHEIDNPFQRNVIAKHEERDGLKFGTSGYCEPEVERGVPERKIQVPKAYTHIECVDEAIDAARKSLPAKAYWWYRAAMDRAPSLTRKIVYEDYAKAQLKTWQAITGK